jgi:hypothetical protein
MRKLRKTGAVDADGNVVTIPRLPSVTGIHKPPGWNRWSAAEKVEHLLGMSLDRMHDYLSRLPMASIHTGLQHRRKSSASLRWSRPRLGSRRGANAIASAPSKRSHPGSAPGCGTAPRPRHSLRYGEAPGRGGGG